MTFKDFCIQTRRAPSEGAEEIYNAARESVAVEIGALFGVSVGTGEARRFLRALERAAAITSIAEDARQCANCFKNI